MRREPAIGEEGVGVGKVQRVAVDGVEVAEYLSAGRDVAKGQT